MKTLVVGATGATGRLLVEQLLKRGVRVKAMVRSADRLPEAIRAHSELTLIEANPLDLSNEALAGHLSDCSAIASCLGHNLTFKGLFGQPRRLVTEATRRLCEAAMSQSSDCKIRFVLMNTSGNRNRDIPEKVSFAELLVVGLLRLLVPPHADNEDAADYLRTTIGRDHSKIEWAAVRPDGLINNPEVTEYELHPSPTRSAIFNAGKTSRINVAHFMADLISKDALWQTWQGQMPVIYNRA